MARILKLVKIRIKMKLILRNSNFTTFSPLSETLLTANHLLFSGDLFSFIFANPLSREF